MDFYAERAALASDMLAEFGSTATHSVTKGSVDVATGAWTETSSEEFISRAVLLQPNPLENDESRVLKTNILAMDKKPTQGATVIYEGEKYTVGLVNSRKPAGTAIIHFAEVE